MSKNVHLFSSESSITMLNPSEKADITLFTRLFLSHRLPLSSILYDTNDWRDRGISRSEKGKKSAMSMLPRREGADSHSTNPGICDELDALGRLGLGWDWRIGETARPVYFGLFFFPGRRGEIRYAFRKELTFGKSFE